ncbi:MAG: hypothetical protein Q4G71_07615 [Pseudomonadota bacterium]|nr:hypothetical protein [Pseudomonadota bacterium]
MAQVTIYLEPAALQAAKAAAERAEMSLSKWFARFAEAEQQQRQSDWQSVFAQSDALRQANEDDGLDFLLDQRTRYADLGTDRPLEPFE